MTRDSAEDGQWEKHSIFNWYIRDEDGTLNYFEDDQPKTTLPTHWIGTFQNPPSMKSGKILRIHYRLNPTNAVTYTLRLWNAAIDGTLTPYKQETTLLYQSPAAQADDTVYDREVVIPFILGHPQHLFFSIDWTGAPGDTPGIIHLAGEVVH